MLKGEKIMRRERLGFKSDEGLIVKSPETEIVAKVELQNNGTAVASLMKWDEVIELDEQANEEKSSSKKKLIAGMILFYLAITGIFICISGVVVGTIVGLYFVTMTCCRIIFTPLNSTLQSIHTLYLFYNKISTTYKVAIKYQ